MRDKSQSHTETVSRGRPREFDRELALTKALELFWSQGYLQTSMNQLCAAMGIVSPSLYCAFGCKADLFLEALAYYKNRYWGAAFENFMAERDIYVATKNLFEDAARILLSPDAPCGCLTVFSAMTLPAKETRILEAITRMRDETKSMFKKRLMMAVRTRQIPEDCDIPGIAGALVNFFEGLSLQARDEICQAELKAIALRGVRLLPSPKENMKDCR